MKHPKPVGNIESYQVESLLIKIISSQINFLNIKDFNESVELTNLPHNEIYTFKVSVYEAHSDYWSEFSDVSNAINMTFSLRMDYHRVGFRRLHVKWNQTGGSFEDYDVSRYLVYLNEEIIYNQDGLITCKTKIKENYLYWLTDS